MRKTTICLDLRCLQTGHESRGIGMHVRSILENLKADMNYTYVFYAYESNNPIVTHAIDVRVPYTLIQTKTIDHVVRSPLGFFTISKLVFHSFAKLRTAGVDIFMQFDFMLGLPSRHIARNRILVAYDLIPLLFKDSYNPGIRTSMRKRKKFRGKIRSGLRAVYYQLRYALHYRNFRKAEILMSVSQNTANSLIEELKVSRKKIVVNPLAPVFNTEIAQRPVNLKDVGPFVFYIGATDARKRVDDLITAFTNVCDSLNISLVLAGKEFAEPKKIPSPAIEQALRQSKHRDAIQLLGYVSDSEKLWLYKNALAFVFPSEYEGFGLPVIEAMQHGCPVIAYNNSSIPEVASDSAILIKTGDVTALSEAIAGLSQSKTMRRALAQQGLARSSVFTWKNHMKQLYEMFGEIE